MSSKLCATCGGNGTLKIPGGVTTCPICDGKCWAESVSVVEGLKVEEGLMEPKGAPSTKCNHGVWIGNNCWQCDNNIPAQPKELPIRELAQEILKPHWPVVRNMDENESREREVDRIVATIERAAQHLKREQEPASQELEVQLDRLDEQWKGRCRVLMGDKEKLKAEVKRLEAAQPPQELVSLVAKWREEAVKGRAKARRVAKNSELTMQELTEYDSAMEQCADELKAALTRQSQPQELVGLRELLGRVKDHLYNAFEPDNQSPLYLEIVAALTREAVGRAVQEPK
jgi:hypothetical protein